MVVSREEIIIYFFLLTKNGKNFICKTSRYTKFAKVCSHISHKICKICENLFRKSFTGGTFWSSSDEVWQLLPEIDISKIAFLIKRSEVLLNLFSRITMNNFPINSTISNVKEFATSAKESGKCFSMILCKL